MAAGQTAGGAAEWVALALGSSNTFGTGDDFPGDDRGFGQAFGSSNAGWYPILRDLLAMEATEIRRWSFPAITSQDFHPTDWPTSAFGQPFFEEAMRPESRGAASIALITGFHVNDAFLEFQPEETRANLEDIFDGLVAAGFDRIYLSIEPSQTHSSEVSCARGHPELWPGNVAALRAIIDERPEVHAGPDFFTYFDDLELRGWWFHGREGSQDCYLHPNGWGYMEMAAEWCRLLRESGELPLSALCNDRPQTPELLGCRTRVDSVSCAVGPPEDADAGQALTQLAWVVPATGFCGHVSDVDRDQSGLTDDDRIEIAGRFEIGDLAPSTDYRVCAVTYDGIQGSFFETREVTTLPEPLPSSGGAFVLLTLLLWKQRLDRRGSRARIHTGLRPRREPSGSPGAPYR